MKRIQLQVNDKTIVAEVSQVDSVRTFSQSQAKILDELRKIGIEGSNVQLITQDTAVRIRFRINDKWYEYESRYQKDLTQNMTAIAIFVEQKVRNIKRAIEPLGKAFSGYLLLTYEDHKGKSVDIYGILEVPKGATQDQVDKAFKLKSQLYHPDSGIQKDGRKFREINEARQEIYKERGWS